MGTLNIHQQLKAELKLAPMYSNVANLSEVWLSKLNVEKQPTINHTDTNEVNFLPGSLFVMLN